MAGLWKNKFVFWNLMALIFVKAVFSYSGFQFANLTDGFNIFNKEEVVVQTNILRQTSGLTTLKESWVLDIAAAQKLQDMIQNQYFAHTSPLGVSPWHWIEVNKYNYSYAGENLAIGFLTAKDTVNGWANSPTHRANLLNSKYQEIGIAVAPTQIQNSQGFLVVQLFGTPKPTVITAAPNPALEIGKQPLAAKNKAANFKGGVKVAAISPTPLASPLVQSATEENPEQPTVLQVNNTSPRLNQMANTFNTAFMLYALLAFLISILVAAFYGLSKGLVIKTAASFAILVLAILVPVIQITHTAMIL